MLAAYAWFDPSLLKPQNAAEQIELLNEDGTKENILVEDIHTAFSDWAELFMLFDDLDNGVAHLSFTEYQFLPAKLQDARRLFRSVKCHIQNEKKI